ncbi:MAG: bifunctional phosphopantothenoylcysteine decarboxylase/phosphopantothenate--cysteine ligase CoaBC [Actinomycetales bacterium]|nr:bifunctional phosphopantothenoylcysteine decarboxylase/phosphopantothenate--cysteine ligase CoaBC [Actinomycetales bacterium]
MRILLGVGAGIAAYKSALLLRLLTEAGHDVRVVPTRASLEFVGRATWEALSGEQVTTDVFDDVPAVEHVSLGREAELVIVAPATADLLARAAAGRCDDLLTAALLTVRCPVLMVPAMHTEMWLHPATRANVATLRERGVHVMEPAVGRLTGTDSGPGRLPEPDDIAAAALTLVAPQDLAGRRVVISAGGTREPIDPVRFLGNRSTGRQGWALARAAARRGAQVTLVAANVALPAPAGVRVVAVETSAELAAAVREEATAADVVVMAAAVADFRPESPSATKIKKVDDGAPTLRLVQTQDVLAGLVAGRRPGQVVVGFAAETGDGAKDVLAHGADKARRKGADLLVVNPVGEGVGFGDVPTTVTVLDAEGQVVARSEGSKDAVADAVWDAVHPRLR